MKVQLNKIIAILFILTYGLLSVTDAIYIAHDKTSIITTFKYLTMVGGIGVGIIGFLCRKNNKFVFYSQLMNYLLIIITFLSISLFKMLMVQRYAVESFIQLFTFALSVMFAFCILNFLNADEINNAFRTMLVIAFGAYVFFEKGIQLFNLSTLRSISYINSYSPFESSCSAGMAINLFMYFAYYRKNNKGYLILSGLFVFFTFKRVSVLYAIILLFVPILVDCNKIISKKRIGFIKVFFIVATIGYYYFLIPNSMQWLQELVGLDMTQFTMGRNKFLTNLLASNYVSYGYGSTINFNGKNLEMDLVRMFVEVGSIGLIVYVNCFWNMAKGNLYCVMICLYLGLTQLVSHTLGYAFAPALSFIIIGTILYKKKETNVRKMPHMRLNTRVKRTVFINV